MLNILICVGNRTLLSRCCGAWKKNDLYLLFFFFFLSLCHRLYLGSFCHAYIKKKKSCPIKFGKDDHFLGQINEYELCQKKKRSYVFHGWIIWWGSGSELSFKRISTICSKNFFMNYFITIVYSFVFLLLSKYMTSVRKKE